MNGNVFRRTSLQQLSSFILYDTGNTDTVENLSYWERLNTGSTPILKRLEKICKDKDEYDIVVADLYNALTVYEEVFTEIGMKSGAKIVFQLLQDDCGEFYKR